MTTPRDLRGLEGLRALAEEAGPLFSGADRAGIPGRLRAAIGLLPAPDPIVETFDEWTRDGVDGTALRWSVGFGAPTEAWLLRPAGERGVLPGVLGLHCHGGAKYFGKEKIADGPGETHPSLIAYREGLYGGRAIANELARGGRAVLAHDVFGWGSRRQELSAMSSRRRGAADLALAARRAHGGAVSEIDEYDVRATTNEDAVAKTLGVLGTSLAGVIAREDLAALHVLDARDDVGRITGVGLSGGGARAAILGALTDRLSATVVIAMMSTLDALLDGHIDSHTWAFMTPGLGRVGDWPDIAGARAPRPLFVGYDERDALFPIDGMRAADRRLREIHAEHGGAYRGVFADAPHSFDLELQAAVAAWLDEQQKEQSR